MRGLLGRSLYYLRIICSALAPAFLIAAGMGFGDLYGRVLGRLPTREDAIQLLLSGLVMYMFVVVRLFRSKK